jgi:hypothetical protein
MTPLLTLVASLLQPGLSPEAPADGEVATYAGTYVVKSGAAAVQADIDAAIETASQQFPAIARGIAKDRLAFAATFCQQYEIEATPDSWTNQCDAMPVLSRPIDSSTQFWISDKGESIPTTITRKGDVIRLNLKGETGTRTNTFKFSGDEMVLHVAIASDSLDSPMTWSIRYALQK